MKKYYLAITIKENDKFYPYAIPVYESDNIVQILAKIENVQTVNIFDTKKHTRIFVDRQREACKRNGTYMF